MIRTLAKKLHSLWQTADEVARGKAVETAEYELEELNHIFALLVFGAFVGIPAPPMQITMELMPCMGAEFSLMLEKVSTAHDPLGDLFSVLDID